MMLEVKSRKHGRMQRMDDRNDNKMQQEGSECSLQQQMEANNVATDRQ